MIKSIQQRLFWFLLLISLTLVLLLNQLSPGNAQTYNPSRYQTLAEADRFYQQGNLEKARELQREVKADFQQTENLIDAVIDTANLKPAAKVYWRIAKEGMEQNLESKIFEPLRLLTETQPEFVPGQLLYADAYILYEQPDKALEILERVTSQYPELKQPLEKKIAVLVQQKQWLEAAIAARQFAVSYPDDPEAAKYQQLAEEYTKKYQANLQEEMIGLGIGNILLSTMVGNNYADANVISLLIQGEAQTGEIFAQQYKSQVTLVENPSQVEYVNNIGQKLAQLMGRNDFNYEFFIVEDPTPNAFALPGGKIFVHTGILKLMHSEAELAGLLGHEIAHAVLSHGFQKMATGALLQNFSQIIPVSDIIVTLGSLEYSRDLEKQADILGTRAIASSGYAADGLHSVMGIFKQLDRENRTPRWLLTHPAPAERVEYLERMIESHGYNRYAYEGVEEYQRIFGSNNS